MKELNDPISRFVIYILLHWKLILYILLSIVDTADNMTGSQKDPFDIALRKGFLWLIRFGLTVFKGFLFLLNGPIYLVDSVIGDGVDRRFKL